ncbi:MAG: FecR domain-containing protein [Bacteroidetes bacterium]|nr:FecR domain-containing protein [Bacteroidota bacterium]
MDNLLIKQLTGEATAAETAQLEQWLSSDIKNKTRYEQLKAVWELSSRDVPATVPDAAMALQRLNQRLEQPSAGTNASPSFVYRFMHTWRVAAAIGGIVCLAAGGYFLAGRQNGSNTGDKGIAGDYIAKSSTKVNPDRSSFAPALKAETGKTGDSIRLPDGSFIRLAEKTAIVYPSGMTSADRTVVLEKGKAFFSVLHNPAKPFRVYVNDVVVRVLGTSFTINAIPGKTDIAVKEGAISVRRGSDSMVLLAGEEISVAEKDRHLNKTIPTPSADTIPQSPSHVADTVYPAIPATRATLPRKKKKTLPAVADTVRRRSLPKKATRSLPSFKADSVSMQKDKVVVMRIIDDMLKSNIIPDKDSLRWFALNNRQMVVDGKNLPDSIHARFRTLYIQSNGLGYYFGPVRVHGAGIYLDRSDLW